VQRLLVTWCDRGILRLLEQREYDRALVLTLPGGSGPAEDLSREMRAHVPEVDVRAVDDPSDHAALLEQLAGEMPEGWTMDVVLLQPVPPIQAKLPDVVRHVESEAIGRAMRQNGGNIVKTSRALGIQRNTLKKKLRAFGLYPAV
jgi:transcriptional regulator of acetoin/glycerol metabolism